MPIRPRSGSAFVGPPEVVVVALLGRGRLEAEHLAALRVDTRHDVPDRAVLAGRVHRLEDHQQRIGVLRVELVLMLRELLDAVFEQREGFLLVLDRPGPIRVVVLERDLLPRLGDEPVHQLFDLLVHRCLMSDRTCDAELAAVSSDRRRRAALKRPPEGSRRRAWSRRPGAWRTPSSATPCRRPCRLA